MPRKKIVFLLLLIPMIAHGMSLRITGDLITSSYIRERINNELQALYGPDASSGSFERFALLPYQKKKLSVPVRLSGEQTATIPVTVTTEKSPSPGEALLLFSNHPELLKANGLLFS